MMLHQALSYSSKKQGPSSYSSKQPYLGFKLHRQGLQKGKVFKCCNYITASLNLSETFLIVTTCKLSQTTTYYFVSSLITLPSFYYKQLLVYLY
jgi:hypothetical protein